MRRQNRSGTFETVQIPVSVIADSDLAKKWLPPLKLIADSELAKMGERGSRELHRREKQRAEHVQAGRVRYVYTSEGYGGRSIWICSPRPKGQERDHNDRLRGHVVDGPHDGKHLALMSLEHHDQGGVIYVDGWDGEQEIVDVRSNQCEALAKTGKHDWFYVPTGDDVCRSCGLVS